MWHSGLLARTRHEALKHHYLVALIDAAELVANLVTDDLKWGLFSTAKIRTQCVESSKVPYAITQFWREAKQAALGGALIAEATLEL